MPRPTSEQCRAYATEHQLLGRDVEISMQRATILMGISRSWTILAGQIERLSVIQKEESE